MPCIELITIMIMSTKVHNMFDVSIIYNVIPTRTRTIDFAVES